MPFIIKGFDMLKPRPPWYMVINRLPLVRAYASVDGKKRSDQYFFCGGFIFDNKKVGEEDMLPERVRRFSKARYAEWVEKYPIPTLEAYDELFKDAEPITTEQAWATILERVKKGEKEL